MVVMVTVDNFDDVLPFTGELGVYQIIVVSMLCVLIIPATYQTFIIYFVAANPPWKCVEDSILCSLNGTYVRDQVGYNFRCSIPRSEWTYVEEENYSIVTEFGLYCDSEIFIFVANSLLFAGSFIGHIFISWMSDKYGRRKTLLPCYFFTLTTAFISAFSPTYWLFAVSRFFVGFFIVGSYMNMVLIAAEIVGPRYRPATGIILWFFFTLALVLLSVVAMYVRTWKMLMIYVTAPYVFLFPLLYFIPESFRWLQVHGRTDQVNKDIQRIAQVNGLTSVGVRLAPVKLQHKSINPLALFKSKKLSIITGNASFSWFVMGMVYFGLSYIADDLGNHFYRDFILVSIVEFPAAILAIFGCTYFGRKRTTQIPMLLGGVFCACVTAIDKMDTREYLINLRVALGMISKLFVTVAFDAIFIWSIEMYPTQIRTEAIAIVANATRVGAMIAPWVTKFLGQFDPKIPFILMGLLAVLSAFFMHWLPETKNQATLEILEDDVHEKMMQEASDVA